MSTNFGNRVERISLRLTPPFTIADISRIIRVVTKEPDTMLLDGKIRYHLRRLKVPKGGNSGQSIFYSYRQPEGK